MVDRYIYGGNRPDRSGALVILVISLVLIASFYTVLKNPEGIPGAVNSVIQFTSDSIAKVNDFISKSILNIKRVISGGQLSVATAGQQIEGSRDMVSNALKYAQFRTPKANTPLGFDIKLENNYITTGDGSLDHDVSIIIPSYVRQKLKNRPIHFTCKPKSASASKKFHACQSKVDGQEFILFDEYNKPFSFRCNFFDLDNGNKQYLINLNFPMYQSGHKNLFIINDQTGLEKYNYDIKKYVENEMLEGTYPTDADALNSPGPLDVQFDAENVLAFDFKGSDEFIELQKPIGVKITNQPKGNLIGGELSFPKDSYIKKFHYFSIRVPDFVQLSCGNYAVKKSYKKNVNGRMWNYYDLDMDFVIENEKNEIKNDFIDLNCGLMVKKSYLIEHDYNFDLTVPIQFETEYDYTLNRPALFSVSHTVNKTERAANSKIRDVLFAIGRGGSENLKVDLSTEQLKFKDFLIEKMYDNTDELVSCICINLFNQELRIAKQMHKEYSKNIIKEDEVLVVS